jgi:hypothetical protein
MARALLAAFAFFLTACSPPEAEPGEGPVLVSVFSPAATGPVPRDGLFASYSIGLEQSAIFLDAAGLASLPARSVRADFPVGSDLRVFSGPRLSDVLAAAGAPDAAARLTAFDGYQIEVTAKMIARHQPVFATHVDGQPLGLGSLGPGVLVWPRHSDERLSDMNDDLWVWGVFAIETLE